MMSRLMSHLLIASSWLLAGCDAAPRETSPTTTTRDEQPVQRIAIEASAKGFVPAEVTFKQHRRAIMTFTRTDDAACARSVLMPWRAEPYDLPVGKPVDIEIPDTSKSGNFTYACWMNMLHGRVVIGP